MPEQPSDTGRQDVDQNPFIPGLDSSGSDKSKAPGVGAGTGQNNELFESRGSVPSGQEPFGALLEPVLRAVTDQRLSGVSWFRTDWQCGGALTGYATYCDDPGHDQAVVVKLPVPPGERQWLVRLQAFDYVVPCLLAHGETLGGYDMAWVVMERLPHGPLGAAWEGREFDLVAEAAGRFYQAAQEFPATVPAATKNWQQILGTARLNASQHSLPDALRWSRTLKKAQRKLKPWVDEWQNRSTDQWCHGDLHLGNAMSRAQAPGGPALLFDLASTHCGHWVEDAIYFEHLYWSSPDRLQGRKLAKMIAHQRRTRGLHVDSEWSRLAQIRRAMLAIATPATMASNWNLRHARAALEVLEAAV